MNDLGLMNFQFRIDQRQDGNGFRYFVSFNLRITQGMRGTAGTADSWEKCIDIVRAYIAQVVRDAVPTGEKGR